MAGRKRVAPGRETRRVSSRRRPPNDDGVVPSIYREMLAEAGAGTSAEEPPLKRKRPGERPAGIEVSGRAGASQPNLGRGSASEEEDDDIEFEDVVLPEPTLQTMMRDSEDEEDDEDDEDEKVRLEDIDLEITLPDSSSPAEAQELNLNLTAQKAAMTPIRSAERRKPVTKAERERRVEVHKVHLLCLLAHAARRNRWCNNSEVQDALRPLLSDKMIQYLNPGTNLSQFGRTESLKNGLQQVSTMFRARYTVTERGIRRALWADEESQLKEYQLPDDVETTFEKHDFQEAARTVRGSRDVGAQLFCALLRKAGVQARLVCSLQPLACVPGAPSMPKPRNHTTPTKTSKAEQYRAAMAIYDAKQDESGTANSPRRRLGHPQATAYQIPDLATSSQTSRRADPDKPKVVRGESLFPVYWVEVLDVAHQKWQPVDPLVTGTQWKTKALEPPGSDRANCLTYAIAFEADGSAKDVTRRYAKAYNSKTRKMRIDGVAASIQVAARDGNTVGPKGERWWKRVMRLYAKPYPTDIGQIEDNELNAEEAKEPMPRNVADFKDHPVYALERHLRRHEVLVPGIHPAGTVGAGSKGPLERIYRRRDVRIARSADKWYRLGREVRIGAEAVKVLPKTARRKNNLGDEADEDDPDKVGLFGDEVPGTPIYMFEQTVPFVPPPVVRGRIPKNKFGNVDVYVPSMVPTGGVHVAHEAAARAAFLLGVDYAPALTGFHFKGRKGTAVLYGAVVAEQCEEAVLATIVALEEMDAEMEQEQKSRKALRLWSRFLKILRIRERVWAGAEPGEEREAESHGGKGSAPDEDMEDVDGVSDVAEEYDAGEDDEGGGFLID